MDQTADRYLSNASKDDRAGTAGGRGARPQRVAGLPMSDAEDTELVALDGDVVGLAESYLRAGRLTQHERTTLHARHTTAERLAAHLTDPARAYAQRLASLARSVLEATAEP
jgi:hypothetical protein